MYKNSKKNSPLAENFEGLVIVLNKENKLIT